MAINSKYRLTAQDNTKSAFASVRRSLATASQAAKRAGMAVGAVGVAAGYMAARMTAAAMESADAMAKQSAKLGVTTEAMAGLRLAAAHAGVAEEAVAKGMTKMQKAISDGADGLSTYVRDFDKLGLNAEELIKLSPDQQLRAIAGAMKNVGSQTERVAIASNLWGAKNTLMLGLTAEGLALAERRTRALGTALTGIEVAKIESANDRLRDMKEAANGVSNSLAVSLSPLIADIAERFVKAAEESGGFRQEIYNLARTAVSAFGKMIDGLVFIRRAALGVKLIIQGIISAWSFLGATASKFFGGDEFRAQQEANFNATIEAIEKTKTAIIDLADLPSYSEAGLQWFDDVQAKAEKAAAVVVKAREDMVAPAAINLEFIDIEAIQSQYIKVKDVAKDTMTEMDQFGVQAARSIQSSFADFLFDPFQNGLDGMFQSFANTLRRMVAELMAQKILSAVFGGTPLGAFFNVPGRAIGGPVSAGSPYIVGERGPELFVPGRSGAVVPNGRLGSGVTVIQHNNIDARGATQDVIKMLPGILAQNRAAAVSEVRDLVRRGTL